MSIAPRRKSVAAYNHGAMLLHWVIALLIIVQLAGGYLMEHYAAMPNPVRFTFYQLHKTFGIIVLLLALMRLCWRLLYKPPAELPIGKAEKLATNSVAFLFYALMIIVPLLGWVIVSYHVPRPIPTLLFGSPHLVWPSLPPQLAFITSAQAAEAHTVLAYSFLFLLFLHICGALKHQFYDHMPMFARMVPSRRLQALPARKGAFLLLFLAVFCLGAAVIYCGFAGARQAETARQAEIQQISALTRQNGLTQQSAAPKAAPVFGAINRAGA